MAGVKRMPEIDRFMMYVDKVSSDVGCWLWTGGKMPRGYGQFRRLHTHELAHRSSLRILKGITASSNMDVMHSCDNPSCVNPDHLSVGSRIDNMQDSIKKGRFQMGERHYKAKLTDAQVAEIRTASGFHSEIAKKYGIVKQQVSRIKSGLRRSENSFMEVIA